MEGGLSDASSTTWPDRNACMRPRWTRRCPPTIRRHGTRGLRIVSARRWARSTVWARTRPSRTRVSTACCGGPMRSSTTSWSWSTNCGPARTDAARTRETVMDIEAKLSALGLELPAPPTPAGNYIGFLQMEDLLFVGGNTGRLNGEPPKYTGKVGSEV